MKKNALIYLILLTFSTALIGQEPPKASQHRKRASFESRSGTALMMMGWGIGLAVGIALLCAANSQNSSTTP